MLAHALEFAPGTVEDCKKVVLGLFEPKALLAAYRRARTEHKTHDIVIVCPDPAHPHALYAGPRVAMAAHLREKFKFQLPLTPAHKIVQMPAEDNAFWVFVPIPKFDMPVMCVVYAVPYSQESLSGQA
jgi:hypothetical protein